MSLFEQQHEAESEAAYAGPPGLHWAVLVAAQMVAMVAVIFLAPKAWWALLLSLVADVWIVYLCVWIRRLNPAFMSLYWCLAFVALELAFTVPGVSLAGSKGFVVLACAMLMLDALLWIATIYVLRAELHFHYNRREPVGLYLSGTMTLFFSYIYFQYHLRRIAQLKKNDLSLR